MYRNIFEFLMRTEPAGCVKKYIFITDREDLAANIMVSDLNVVCLREGREGFFNTESFLSYLDSLNLKGTYRSSYLYVPACTVKKQNEQLELYFEQAGLTFRQGWKLFCGKEYLARPDHQEEMKKRLMDFIECYEEPHKEGNLDRFHVLGKEGDPVSVLDLEIVEYLLQNVHFFVLGGTPYVYEHGVYVEDSGGIRLKARIQKLVYRKFVKSPTLQRVYSLLISQPCVQKQFHDLYNMPVHWVNFRNGYYDPVDRKMISHDPAYLSINQIDMDFYPEKRDEILAGGNVIKAYMETSLPDPVEQEMVWEYLGYCMTPDTQMQKFLMLVGNGGTGKSVLISLFQKVIGIGNCSSISLQDLNRRFYATGLFGKLLNACGDIPCKSMEATDVVKKAVGEDSILYEKKGQDPIHFFSHAKLLFSANGMPENLEDKSDAFYRRLLILEMNHVIEADRKDTGLKDRIGQETDYAVHKAMDSLHYLYQRGAFEESENSQKCIREAKRDSDIVQAFLDETVERIEGCRIAKSTMYDLYESYCRENGRKPMGKSQFVMEMERKGFVIKKYDGIYKFKDVEKKEIPSDFS